MKTIHLLVALLAVAATAATRVQWAPKSDKGFDQAMESGKFVLQLFVEPKCPECGLFEKTAFRDEDVLTLLESRFVSIRSNVATSEARADAENYGVETYPTVLFFNSKGEQIHEASLQGASTSAEFLRHLLDVTTGKFEKASIQSGVQATGTAVEGAKPTSGGWSRPDTSASIEPPPLPDTASQASP
ncbi:MAG: thioredoxin family protein [Fibrobacteria bacterium]|nr:thioredoxin family protein [Fibrobacteria bacterium]